MKNLLIEIVITLISGFIAFLVLQAVTHSNHSIIMEWIFIGGSYIISYIILQVVYVKFKNI